MASDLDDADRLGTPIQEETVTETMLLNFARNNRTVPHFRSYAFSRSTEAVTGADWLWLVRDATGKRAALLVQAKKLRNGRYALNQPAAPSQQRLGFGPTLQRDLLLEKSGRLNIGAAYVFYNPSSHLPANPCSWFPLFPNLGGVSIAGARALDISVRRSGASGVYVKADAIARHCWSLSCAMLCPTHHPLYARSHSLADLVTYSLHASGVTIGTPGANRNNQLDESHAFSWTIDAFLAKLAPPVHPNETAALARELLGEFDLRGVFVIIEEG